MASDQNITLTQDSASTPSNPNAASRDYRFAIIAGLLIGFLFLPVLKAANPSIYAKFWLAVVPFFFIATPLGMRVALAIGRKIPVVTQIAKFGVSGVLNTMVDAGILMFLSFFFSQNLGIAADKVVFLGVAYYSLYKAFSFIIANINSYIWNRYWTFSQAGTEQAGRQFMQFFVVSIIGFLINVIAASSVFKFLILGTSDQRQLLGAIAGTLIGLIWNFVGYKFWVFKK